MPEARPREVILGGNRYGISEQGAHVTAWSSAEYGDVLYLSSAARFADGTPIRGGVPICFPWFAAGPQGDRSPAHGFARTTTWRPQSWVVREGTAVLEASYELTTDDLSGGARAAFPYEFTARYDVALAPAHARFTLRVTNHDRVPFNFEAALHTYLRVGDVATIQIAGLEGAEYVDKTDDMRTKTQPGPLCIDGEVDRIYDSVADVVLRDDVLDRTIRIRGLGAPHTVVWNPGQLKAGDLPDVGEGEWREFACVESATTGPRAVTLQPGARHELEQQVFLSRG